ncbi:hypothetical protein SI65_06961 [Aspergillus cristatus]|uniref:Uncharacterized protein n=1 Tax=Aspergillus cristatus TaxID=573508 RepID=A0A1E3BA52_ASPCR|nr:hypothetical protein SI65_06961 [Aspergillus cristatus]
MPHPPIVIPPVTKTCPTCRQTKPEDQFRRGRKRLSEESVVVFDNTAPLPTNTNTTNTFYQPIAPRPTHSAPPNREDHGTQNVFRVEPPKRKKMNRKKKDHEEEPQLMDIGSLVLGPMGPSFELLPSLQANSRCRSRENRSEMRERVSTVDSTMSQSRGSSSRPRGAEREMRVSTIDLTDPERQRQSRGSSWSVPPRPLTDEGGSSVRSMILGPMGPSFAVLPGLQSKSRPRENGSGARETVDLTETEPRSRGADSRPLLLRPQEHGSESQKQQVGSVGIVPAGYGPRSQSSSRSMLLRLQTEHGAEREQRVRTVDTSEPEPQSQGSSTQPLPSRPQERQVRTVESTELDRQPRDSSSRPLPPRLPTNDGDLERNY